MDSLLSEFDKNEPSSTDAIAGFEIESGMRLPEDYAHFMLESDGGEGFIGNGSYLVLWPIGELIEANADYEIANDYPGIFLIGSNGGGEAFAIDSRNPRTACFVKVPFIGMAEDQIIPLASSFHDFLNALANDTESED